GGVAAGVAARLQLLEVRELADVDLGREVAPNRLLERLARLEPAAGQRPGAGVGGKRALPEQRLQQAVAHLEDDGQHGVGGVCDTLVHEVFAYQSKTSSGGTVKKLLVLAAASLLAVAAAGCGGSSGSADSTSTS